MPPTKHPDPLADLLKSFALLSASGDANGWLAARALWGPELRASVAAHAPKRSGELEGLLARPIPPAFPVEPPPPDTNLQKHLGQHRLARDAAAHEVTTAILAMLQEIHRIRTGKAGKRK